jgi:hypothetical protein
MALFDWLMLPDNRQIGFSCYRCLRSNQTGRGVEQWRFKRRYETASGGLYP